MTITHDDIQELKRVFDDRYVLQSACDTSQQKISSRFANDDKRIDRILLLQENTTKSLQKNNWLTTAILSVIIGIVVTMILKSIGVF